MNQYRLVATEQIEAAIAEAGGNIRDALNKTLAQRDLAYSLLLKEENRSATLTDALETIQAVARMYGIPAAPPPLKTIDKIAREVLRVTLYRP